MQVFLTGGTGYVGSAILDALLKAGHSVTALVRDREKAARVRARGVNAIIGSLDAPPRWRDAASGADVVIHAAIDYVGNSAESDRVVLDTVLPLAPPVFLYTSGVWVLGPAPTGVDEQAPVSQPAQISAWRAGHERRVLEAGRPGARTVVVRPGIVYGGARGIVSDMLKDAGNGLIRVIGTGENHWPLVYDRDLGDLYVRLATSGDASGIYHATDSAEETVNEIVEAIRAAVAQAPTVSQTPAVRHVPLDEARKKLGPYADALALDQIVRSTRARRLGWTPMLRSVSGNVPRLLEEFRRGKEAAA
ncbi:MAG TPA: NAD-dependent epimerase/dehydratase family protein [Vicinamibacterales bacterium]|nr:NAD-dependent epimerase/dehydratase family protein [Vicinamibacterales bacterium]